MEVFWVLIWTTLMFFCKAFERVNVASHETKSFTTTASIAAESREQSMGTRHQGGVDVGAATESKEQSRETRHQKGNFSIPIAVGISCGSIILLVSIGLAMYAFRLPKLILINPIVIGGRMQRRTGVRSVPYAVRRMPYEGRHGKTHQMPRPVRQTTSPAETSTGNGQSEPCVIYEIGPFGVQMSDYEIAVAENNNAEDVAETNVDVTDDAGTYYSSLLTETKDVYTQLRGNNISEAKEDTGNSASDSGTYYSPLSVEGRQATKDGSSLYTTPIFKGHNTPAGTTQPGDAETEQNKDASTEDVGEMNIDVTGDARTHYSSLQIKTEAKDVYTQLGGNTNSDMTTANANENTGDAVSDSGTYYSPLNVDVRQAAKDGNLLYTKPSFEGHNTSAGPTQPDDAETEPNMDASTEDITETNIDITDDAGTHYSSLQIEAKDVYTRL